MKRRRYAAVGIGGRIPMFIDPIADRYRDACELVGLCDSSRVRGTFHQQRLVREYGGPEVPLYSDFGLMLREQKPDIVIVCTPDYLHHQFIVQALEFGADVISEKPLTIDAPRCQEIFDAVKRTGRTVQTTFNMRWTPGISKVREVIASGVIGRVRHIDFEYTLNTSHGADYFRRWHSHKELSGGLLLHKSTHHFDVINWWLDGIPAVVFAMGDLVFYGKKNAFERGQAHLTGYDRYTGSADATTDPFRLAVDEDPTMKALYHEAEEESGYIRDQNVFREGIDIEDSMSLLIKYRTGEVVNYSLNAYSPKEGFRASISGDGGRIEYVETHASHIITGSKEVVTSGGEHTMRLHVQRLFKEAEVINVPVVAGNHGGGDHMMQQQMFAALPPDDKLGRHAGHEQGAASLLVGAAANISMKTGQPVRIDELLPFRPDARRLHELI